MKELEITIKKAIHPNQIIEKIKRYGTYEAVMNIETTKEINDITVHVNEIIDEETYRFKGEIELSEEKYTVFFFWDRGRYHQNVLPWLFDNRSI